MSDGSNTRRVRRSRPGLEGLEGRELLSGAGLDLSAQAVPAAASRVRRLDYTTPQGTRVNLSLYGVGTMAGTTVDPDGALNLVFSGTNGQSGIIARAHGGDGHPLLRSVRSGTAQAGSLSGIGGSLIDIVSLKDFELVGGGRVNLTSGVHVLNLNSTAADTQVSLRELPEAVSASGTASQNGETLTYATDAAGGLTLVGVAGQFVAAPSVITKQPSSPTTGSNPGPPPAPPGVVVSIDHVNGPSGVAGAPGDAQVFGYDPAQNALVRFDTATGNPTLTIHDALPTPGSDAGVTLARDTGRLVVLVGNGSNVFAYDALNGSPAGSFATDTLTSAGFGLNSPTRLGSFDAFTVIADPNGGANGLGLVQPIDVTRSLADGHARPAIDPATGRAVAPFASQRAFGLAGGLAGVPGSGTLFATGGAHFDAFQPLQFQLGVAALNGGGTASLRESARTAVTVNGRTVPTDASGRQGPQRNDALGSIGQNLALVSGLGTDPATGRTFNRVSLLNPQGLAKTGEVALNDPNELTGLSGTFRPALVGSALVDVQGNTQSFRSRDARGLVFNGEGVVNLVKIHSAADTTIAGFPFGHAEIPRRTNVLITSSSRVVDGRNGVTVVPTVGPTGPLSLP